MDPDMADFTGFLVKKGSKSGPKNDQKGGPFWDPLQKMVRNAPLFCKNVKNVFFVFFGFLVFHFFQKLLEIVVH